MLDRLRQRLSFANVISLIALFVALGGVSYAAVTLPKNSVGNKQIKRGAVTSGKVRNGTLSSADFSASTKVALQGPRGATGARGTRGVTGLRGTAGATGARGATGAAGPFPSAALAAGATVRGRYAIAFPATSDASTDLDGISFGFLFTTPPTPYVVPAGGPAPSQCPGNATTPTAVAGALCLYETTSTNVGTLAVQNVNGAAGADAVGATIAVTAAAPGPDTIAIGSWAATSP